MPVVEDPFYRDEQSPTPSVRLDVDSLYEVFGQFVQMAPIHKAVALRSLNWQVCRAINYALFKTTELNIKLKWHVDRLNNPDPLLIIQGSQMKNIDKAMECIDFILMHVRMLTSLNIDVEVNNAGKILDQLLEKFIGKHNVQLEVLKIRRRYVGESFTAIADLIYEHAATLKHVGRIGMMEAMEGFSDKLHLERLSLMNFDLIDDGDMESRSLMEKTRYYMGRLAQLGATFEHLSYTTFAGFELSKQPSLTLLRNGNVKSFRLTMQKGNPLPFLMNRVLLDKLESLEFVGDMDIDCSSDFGHHFPKLNHFDFDRHDLSCGA